MIQYPYNGFMKLFLNTNRGTLSKIIRYKRGIPIRRVVSFDIPKDCVMETEFYYTLPDYEFCDRYFYGADTKVYNDEVMIVPLTFVKERIR